MAFEHASATASVTDTLATVNLGGFFRSGFIYNNGSTAATVYINSSSAVATIALAIPAGLTVSWDKIESGTISSFSHKTASSTTTLIYNFYN